MLSVSLFPSWPIQHAASQSGEAPDLRPLDRARWLRIELRYLRRLLSVMSGYRVVVLPVLWAFKLYRAKMAAPVPTRKVVSVHHPPARMRLPPLEAVCRWLEEMG